MYTALTSVAQLGGCHPAKRKVTVPFQVRAHAGLQASPSLAHKTGN